MSGFSVSAGPATAPKELIPAGPQVAICTQLIVLGTVTQLNRAKGVEESKLKLHIGFELCDVQGEYDGKVENRITSKRYNLTLHENATLTADLIAWRGRKFTDAELKSFDMRAILGAPVMLNITHDTKDGKTYANVGGMSPLHKSIPKPTQTLPTVKLDVRFPEDCWDWDAFEKLPAYLKDIMRATPEFKALNQPAPAVATQPAAAQQPNLVEVEEDQLPF